MQLAESPVYAPRRVAKVHATPAGNKQEGERTTFCLVDRMTALRRAIGLLLNLHSGHCKGKTALKSGKPWDVLTQWADKCL